MAVSGVTSWDPTRNEIISDALFNVGAVGPGAAIPEQYMQVATRRLNALVKTLQADGMSRWLGLDQDYTLTASSEVTGSDGSVYTCRKSHTSAALNKPVTGAEWSTYWDKSGSTGGVWATATAYTSIADFSMATTVIGAESAFYRDTNSVDYEIDIIAYDEYLRKSDKYDLGRPIQMAVDWTLTPTAYLYPVPDATTYVIHVREIREINDFTAAGQTADFPKLWNDVLVWGLTEQLSHGLGKEINERQVFQQRYKAALAKVKGYDITGVGINEVMPAFVPSMTSI